MLNRGLMRATVVGRRQGKIAIGARGVRR
jgi:hypothetical protein